MKNRLMPFLDYLGNAHFTSLSLPALCTRKHKQPLDTSIIITLIFINLVCLQNKTIYYVIMRNQELFFFKYQNGKYIQNEPQVM